jgi:hypothetical protein
MIGRATLTLDGLPQSSQESLLLLLAARALREPALAGGLLELLLVAEGAGGM